MTSRTSGPPAATGGATRTSAGGTGTPAGRRCPAAAVGAAASTPATVPAARPETGRRAAGTTTAHHGGQTAKPPNTASRPPPAPPSGRPRRPAAATTPAPRGGQPPTTSPRPTTRPWTPARAGAMRPATSPRWSCPRSATRLWMTPGTGRTRGARRRPRRPAVRAGPGSEASATMTTTGRVRNGTSSPTSSTGPSFPPTSRLRPWRGRAGPRAMLPPRRRRTAAPRPSPPRGIPVRPGRQRPTVTCRVTCPAARSARTSASR